MIPRLALFSSRYYRLVNNQMNIVNRNKAYYRSGAVKVREKSDFEEKQMDFYGHKIFFYCHIRRCQRCWEFRECLVRILNDFIDMEIRMC